MIEKYNTRVRQAISDNYMEYSKTKAMAETEKEVEEYCKTVELNKKEIHKPIRVGYGGLGN